VLAHRADLSADAVDISPAALAVAQRNARKNGVSDRVRFLLENVLSPKTKEKRRYDAILSNPPYIRTDVIPTLAPELAYEPRLALDGGEDGLCFYDALLSHYEAPLFLLEIGFDQGKDVLSLSKERGFDATVLRDAGGCDRLAVLQKK
jgi:release factor glutamine methyltransferase